MAVPCRNVYFTGLHLPRSLRLKFLSPDSLRQTILLLMIALVDHRPLYCENGEFAMKYAHNYQHASMYPAFVLSGELETPSLQLDSAALVQPISHYTLWE